MIESIEIVNSSIKENILIDKAESMYVLDEADLGTIEAAHQTSKYPSQIGEVNTNSALGTRPISITGWVIGKTELEIKNKKTALNSVINPLQFLELHYDKYMLVFKPKNTIKYSTNYSENNEVLCKFLISGVCFDPLFRDNEISEVIAAQDVGMFHFPLEIPEEGIIMSYRTPSLVTTVENTGNIDTGFKIIIEATADDIVNPKITNLNTQEFIQIDKTLSAGEVIEIITEDDEEGIYGIVDGQRTNYFKYFDLDSTWLRLNIGTNSLAYSADDKVELLNVIYEFSNKYLEVQ